MTTVTDPRDQMWFELGKLKATVDHLFPESRKCEWPDCSHPGIMRIMQTDDPENQSLHEAFYCYAHGINIKENDSS